MKPVRAIASTVAAAALLVGGFGTPAIAAPSAACANASSPGADNIKKCRVAYKVRVEAINGQDPASGTLRIACPKGYELSPPTSDYNLSFGAVTPDGYLGQVSSVTRTARTPTSFEIDYILDPTAPIGTGLFLEGWCVPV